MIPSFNTSIVSTTPMGNFNSASMHVRLLLPGFSTDLSPLHQASPLDLPLGYHCHNIYPHKVFPSCYSFAASAHGHRGFTIYRLSPDFLPTLLRVLRLRFTEGQRDEVHEVFSRIALAWWRSCVQHRLATENTERPSSITSVKFYFLKKYT